MISRTWVVVVLDKVTSSTDTKLPKIAHHFTQYSNVYSPAHKKPTPKSATGIE